MAVLAGRGSGGGLVAVLVPVVVVVVVIVRLLVLVGLPVFGRGGGARRRRRPSANSIQPPIARIEIAATTGAAFTTRSGGSSSLGADHEGRQDEDADGVRQRHRQPQPGGMERRPAGP
jgi:hypothetical protein